MYRNMIFVTGAFVAAAPTLFAGCIPTHSARAARWEMPGVDDAKTDDPAKRDPSKAAEASAEKVRNEALRSQEAGRSVKRLPASCSDLAYVNAKALGEFGPIATNESAIRDRVKVLLDGHKDLESMLREGLEALHAKGLYWRRDLEEVSACFDKAQVKVMVVAGSFESSDLLSALRDWAKRRGGSADVVDRAGHSYAMVGGYYAAQVAPGMVAIAKEMDAVDAANNEGPGLIARGGGAERSRAGAQQASLGARAHREPGSHRRRRVGRQHDHRTRGGNLRCDARFGPHAQRHRARRGRASRFSALADRRRHRAHRHRLRRKHRPATHGDRRVGPPRRHLQSRFRHARCVGRRS